MERQEIEEYEKWERPEDSTESEIIEESDYHLQISLDALNHLGLNLYSNIPAVISEVVANSYDADAEKVTIDIDNVYNRIIITDDGHGMTKEECNKKYLIVGYDRRKDVGVITPKHKRHVMGRKGIGKLSLFSVAKTIEVHTVKINEKGNEEKSGFIMDADKIKSNIQKKVKECPLPAVEEDSIKINKGTCIILSNLKKELIGTETHLRKRLARRFSVIGYKDKFFVVINEKPVTIEDRDYFKKIEYLWYIGDYGKQCMAHCTKLSKNNEIDGTVDAENGYKVTGWVGTFDERKSIEKGNNTIVIYAWGKVIHEDILKDMEEGGVFSKYLIGEIRADFLDLDDKEDISTSDRQSVKEDDPRFVKLRDWINKKILKEIQSNWTEWRKEDATEKALENPKIKQWFEGLKGDLKQYAKRLFMKIESFPIEDPQYKNTLYKHGIIAFETLALKDSLGTLDSINTDEEFKVLISLFDGLDQLEALHYNEIVKNRIGVIKKFVDIVPESKEKVIQEFIFNHLWLLDPSWERADVSSPHIEEAVNKEFKKLDAGLTPEEKEARIDIRYRTAIGKHIIIELKKYDAKVNVFELAKQIGKYRSALLKCLEAKMPHEDHDVEIICILGSPPTGSSKTETRELLKVLDTRYITYDQLIKETLEGYKEYLDKAKHVSEIQDIIDSI